MSLLHAPADSSLAKYLAKKLQQAHVAQRQSTRYFASLSARAGAATVNEWLQIPIDDQAPTPNTFRQKEEDFPESALLLNREDCEYDDPHLVDIGC